MSLQPTTPGVWQVNLDIGSPREGCGGTVEGQAVEQDGAIVLSPLGPRNCRMTIRRSDRAVSLQSQSCDHFHGERCSFDGTLNRYHP